MISTIIAVTATLLANRMMNVAILTQLSLLLVMVLILLLVLVFTAVLSIADL